MMAPIKTQVPSGSRVRNFSPQDACRSSAASGMLKKAKIVIIGRKLMGRLI